MTQRANLSTECPRHPRIRELLARTSWPQGAACLPQAAHVLSASADPPRRHARCGSAGPVAVASANQGPISGSVRATGLLITHLLYVGEWLSRLSEACPV